MTETRYKLEEAYYFFYFVENLFNKQQPEYVYHLNAFVNAARNVTFVLQKEYAHVQGFDEWWHSHHLKEDRTASKFIDIRNISVKEKVVRENQFKITQSFGPEGLHVVGHHGPTSVHSEPIRANGPIPTYGYATVTDDNGTRKVRYDIIHDFSVTETTEHGTKEVKFDNFIKEAKQHFNKLQQLVEECEIKFKLM